MAHNKNSLFIRRQKEGAYKTTKEYIVLAVDQESGNINIEISKNKNMNPDMFMLAIGALAASFEIELPLDKRALFRANLLEIIDDAERGYING